MMQELVAIFVSKFLWSSPKIVGAQERVLECTRGAIKRSSKSEKEKLTGRGVRRNYTEEFRRDAVGMIEREGLTAADVSRRLGVNVNLLRKSQVKNWFLI